jgi:hypothetical protein
MKKTEPLDTSPSFVLFMMSLYLGFLGLFMPWSSAYFRTHTVGASMPQLMGQPLSFWQSSFFSLVFRQAPCRTWIATQANTPQGSILNSVQIAGFFALLILVLFWLGFLWVNRRIMTQAQRKQLLQTSLILVSVGTLVIVRMATFASCSSIQSIELLDVHLLAIPLFFCTFSILFAGIAIGKVRTMLNEMESD